MDQEKKSAKFPIEDTEFIVHLKLITKSRLESDSQLQTERHKFLDLKLT